ncbi:MAG: hypothetical protein ABJJ09_18690 [Ascidiaceihabitans sp.]|uniref:hypothetical protein n=2 Tax=Ascidiaceihabitans sp. TaxID=1872644 RepID=UPI003297228E
MMGWVQKQSMAVRLCFAFAYCGLFYALLILVQWATFITAVTLVMLTVFPFLYGTAASLALDPRNESGLARILGLGLIPIALLCVALLIAQLETLICVVILAPVFIGLMMLGQFVMRAALRRALVASDNATLHVSVLLLPLLAVPVFGQITFPEAQMQVVTEIQIAAPVETVWAHTYEIEAITDQERIWTFSHNILGTPLPINAVVDGTIRQLRWSGGMRFQEHLTGITQHKSLSWDFVFNEKSTMYAMDPHVDPQGDLVNLHSGFYELTALPNGDTLLTLQTNYSVTTPLNGYLSLWGEVFLQDFHRSVLSVIKMRSEAAI